MWPFRRKRTPHDWRLWNEDWKVGDTAECIVDGVSSRWHDCVPPWHRPALGQQFTVTGFSEILNTEANVRAYCLQLKGWPVELATTAFRKVRSVSAERSEVVSRILNARPGVDRVREET